MKIVTRIPKSVHQHWSQYGNMSYVFNYLVDHYDFMNAMPVEYPLDEKVKVTLTVTSDEYLRTREVFGERTPWLSPARILSYFKEVDAEIPPQESDTVATPLHDCIDLLSAFVRHNPRHAETIHIIVTTLKTIIKDMDNAEE